MNKIYILFSQTNSLLDKWLQSRYKEARKNLSQHPIVAKLILLYQTESIQNEELYQFIKNAFESISYDESLIKTKLLALLDRLYDNDANLAIDILDNDPNLLYILIENKPITIGYAKKLLEKYPLTPTFILENDLYQAYQQIAKLDPKLAISSDPVAEVHFRSLLDQRKLQDALNFYINRSDNNPKAKWHKTDIEVLVRELNESNIELDALKSMEQLQSFFENSQSKTRCYRWAASNLIKMIREIPDQRAFITDLIKRDPVFISGNILNDLLAYCNEDKQANLSVFYELVTKCVTETETQFSIVYNYINEITETVSELRDPKFDSWFELLLINTIMPDIHNYINGISKGVSELLDLNFDRPLLTKTALTNNDGFKTNQVNLLLKYRPELIKNNLLIHFIQYCPHDKPDLILSLLEYFFRIDQQAALVFIESNKELIDMLEPNTPIAKALYQKISSNKKSNYIFFPPSSIDHKVARLSKDSIFEYFNNAKVHLQQLIAESKFCEAFNFYKNYVSKNPGDKFSKDDLIKLATGLENLNDLLFQSSLTIVDRKEKYKNFRLVISGMIDVVRLHNIQDTRFKLNQRILSLVEHILRTDDENYTLSNEEFSEIDKLIQMIEENQTEIELPSLKEAVELYHKRNSYIVNIRT